MAQTEEQQKSPACPLLDPDGPELGDDFLALSGERNRRFVERLRVEEEAVRQEEAGRLDRLEHPRIGVLALQGDYAAHAAALEEAGAKAVEVRNAAELESLDGLILPGGESSTMLKFLESRGLFNPLEAFCRSKPVFGTCAGAILLAREVRNPPQRSLGLLDAIIERNAYGRQIDSSILEVETKLPGGPLEMVFIRAPRIVEIGPDVEALAFREGYPTLVRQGSVLAATFHPELSSNRRVHQLFVDSVKSELSRPASKVREFTKLPKTQTSHIETPIP